MFEEALLHRDRQDAPSAILFEASARQFDAGGSPMAGVARYLSVEARFPVAKVDDSLEQLRRIRQQIAPEHIALRALFDSAIGNGLAERGDVYDALEAYTLAERAFDQVHEVEGVARMRASLAHMLTLMGQPGEAWRVRRAAFAAADRSGNKDLLETVIGLAASDEVFERDTTSAIALYSALLHRPVVYRPPAFPVNFWRSSAKLMTSEVALNSINGRALRPDVENDLRFAGALNICQIRPREAEARLSECIAYSDATGRVLMLPYIYLFRASVRRAIHDEDGALSDLRRSFVLLEERGTKIRRRELRDVWSTVADDTVDELIDVYCKRKQEALVFELGERVRGRVFLDEMHMLALSAEQVARKLEPGMGMMVFTSSSRHTVATLIERGRIHTFRIPQSTGSLIERKRKLRDAICRGRHSEAAALSESLYDLLIRPLGVTRDRVERLIIVADQPLRDLAFSFLRDRSTGQYLIEQFELSHAPSASVFVQTPGTSLSRRTVVTIGDPAFNQQAYPLPSLPAAKDESLSVARQYPEARALVGSQATFQNLARNVPDADVIDIAAHTIPSAEDPLLSELLLAADGQQTGACGLRKIASLPVKRGSTVVIAGCQTGVSREPGDLHDFAGSFLAAGAGNAVATLWDVEDNAAREFSLRFHRALNEGVSAAAAERKAQLSMLKSADAEMHKPSAWSGFQVYALSR